MNLPSRGRKGLQTQIWGLFFCLFSLTAQAATECQSDSDCRLLYDSCGCIVVFQSDPRETWDSGSPKQCKCNECNCGTNRWKAACVENKCTKVRSLPVKAQDPPADLQSCTQDSDCIVVPYRHCCGTTKRVIHRRHEAEYRNHPEWQKFDDAKACAVMGACRPDKDLSTAVCHKSSCSLLGPAMSR